MKNSPELTGLVRYDAMVHAIAECYAVDEVKDIRDKAMALERYAQQAMNYDAERKALEIRLRAERKAGQLLKETEKQAGARGKPGPGRGNKTGSSDTTPFSEKSEGNKSRGKAGSTSKTLSDMGISKDQSSNWQKLADVPEEDFEEALSSPGRPSTAGILRVDELKKGKKSIFDQVREQEAKVSEEALWACNLLCSIEEKGLLSISLDALENEMMDTMREKVVRLRPLVRKWLSK